jgi:hypothetical protein
VDDPKTTTDDLGAAEDILSYTVSDDSLEAAAGIERMGDTIRAPMCRDTLIIATCPS